MLTAFRCGLFLRSALGTCLLFAVAGSAAAVEPPPPPQVKFLLQYKFKPGEEIRWDVIHKATVKSTVQGSSQTAWTSSNSAKVWRIDKVTDDGEITFTHLVERVQMANQISGRAKVEWDSAAEGEPPVGFQDAAKAVGVPLTEVRMDASGKIIQRLEKHSQPSANNDTPITVSFPTEKVSIGHVWLEPHDVKVTLKSGGTKAVQTRRRFELKSVKHGVATIAVDFQILTPLQDPALEAQLVQRLAKGEMRFDIEAGRMLSQQLDVDKRLHDFSGPGSLMHYVSRFTEELVDPNASPETRAKPDPEVAVKPMLSTPAATEKK